MAISLRNCGTLYQERQHKLQFVLEIKWWLSRFQQAGQGVSWTGAAKAETRLPRSCVRAMDQTGKLVTPYRLCLSDVSLQIWGLQIECAEPGISPANTSSGATTISREVEVLLWGCPCPASNAWRPSQTGRQHLGPSAHLLHLKPCAVRRSDYYHGLGPHFAN